MTAEEKSLKNNPNETRQNRATRGDRKTLSESSISDRSSCDLLMSVSRKERIGQVSRPISTAQLNALLHLHLRPINVLVSNGPSVPYGSVT